jgi:predicted MPP superfamily phosphohydrolase
MWVLLIFPYAAIKLYVDTSTILVDNHRIDIPQVQLDPDDPLRIVHISDIQADAYTGDARMAAYNEKVEEAQPDLVIFTGDVISYGTDYVAKGAEYLGNLQPHLGTWAVMGDHDYWAGIDTVMSAVRAQGITILDDQRKELTTDRIKLNMVGILNVYSRRPSLETFNSLMDELATDSSSVQLLISHQMDQNMAERAAEYGTDLILSGHTHGGQMAFPFWGWQISGPSLETDLLNGLYDIKGTPLNVNSGLGFTLAPVRYNAPAAITVLDIY